MRRSLLVLFLVVLVSVSAGAATFDRVTDTDLLVRSDIVVVATVVESTPGMAGQLIVTDSKLLVHDVLKGKVDAMITVREAGGFLNGRGMLIPGSATYPQGARVLAFLKRAADGTYYTAFMGLGQYRFERPEPGIELLARSGANIEMIDGESADVREAASFLEAIRRGTPEKAPRFSRSAINSLQTLPSANAAEDFAIKCNGGGCTVGQPIRWDCDGGCTINFKTNGTQAAVADPLGDIDDVMNTWDTPHTYLAMNRNGTSTASNFDDRPDPLPPAKPDNVILLDFAGAFPGFCPHAIGCSAIYFGQEHSFEGADWYSIEETTIGVKANLSGASFKAVMIHELGHAVALDHAPSGSNVMRSTVGSQTSLGPWDSEAIATVYGTGLPCTPVDITSHTPNTTIPYNTQVTLSVGLNAGATAPVTYQWYKGNSGDTSTPVSTATQYKPTLTETSSFWVRVNNCGGPDDSPTITITVEDCIPLQISKQPTSTRIDPHTSTSLEVLANGTPEITYQWYVGTAPNTSTPATGSSAKTKKYTTPMLTTTTSYWVKITNPCGSLNSNTATVTVGTQCVQPTATLASSAITTQIFGTASMSVIASGDSPYTYQWYEGVTGDTSKPIAGATAETYTTPQYASAGTYNYWVQVKNPCPGTANSATVTVTVQCVVNLETPQLFAPPSSPRSQPYEVTWTGNVLVSPTFELQESTDPDFINPVTTFVVNGKQKIIPAHTEVNANQRFYYRVRPISICGQQPGSYSKPASTLVLIPLPPTSNSFTIGVPVGSTEPFVQDYLVPGFGATATAGDTFAISIDSEFLTVFPASGALSAGGTTVQFSADPEGLPAGSLSATVTVTRTQGPGKMGTHATSSTTSVPFSFSLVTPVTPDPRTGDAPPGTLVIPAIAHVDGFNTKFQSDIRIANISDQDIEYQMTYTPSGANGAEIGKQTNVVIAATDSKSFDDIVNVWYGSGQLGETGFGTLEVRPLNAPNEFATVASSRTYAISSDPDTGAILGTLGQFIPALGLDQFIGSFGADPSAKISLQQIANGVDYRTNLGFVEGAGTTANLMAQLFDGNNNLLGQALVTLPPFGHTQALLSNLPWTNNGVPVPASSLRFEDGRLETTVLSDSGKVTAYASVLDNVTNDPLMVFPEQASKISATHYVLPGVADITGGSTFESDVRIFNGGSEPVTLTLGFEPLSILSTPTPPDVPLTINAGQVLAIDDPIQTIWGITQTAGAILIDSSGPSSIVATGRTFSPLATGGTNGQFIPAVTAADAVGLGERSLTILQLESSPQYRTNLGLVEVTGHPVTVEITGYKPDSKISVTTEIVLGGDEFFQQNGILGAMFGGDTNVYGGRISLKVTGGEGRVAAYGSIVDMRTSDPTYVPAQ